MCESLKYSVLISNETMSLNFQMFHKLIINLKQDFLELKLVLKHFEIFRFKNHGGKITFNISVQSYPKNWFCFEVAQLDMTGINSAALSMVTREEPTKYKRINKMAIYLSS